jgi:DNA uptake protein ComE-like DNA-binding protein
VRIRHNNQNGSVLVIVMWVAFGLVSIALYFGHSMSFELRAADNRVAGVEAEQAIEGAARYVAYILGNQETNGWIPDPQTYLREAVPVGDATYWLIARDTTNGVTDKPTFGLLDESSKLNLNTATLEMLQNLPRMTPEFAAAIIDWRDTDSNPGLGGAEDETYQRLSPAYRCKNANFESVDELRMVVGADVETLYGEDANLNGVMDANENDGEASAPIDDKNGRLDPGVLEYLTAFTREPANGIDGSPRINLSRNPAQQLSRLLQQNFDARRAAQIAATAGLNASPPRPGQPAAASPTFTSPMDFYLRSRMTPDEFALVAPGMYGPSLVGLVNINTASEAVLGCIPGIGTNNAASVVAFRQSSADRLTSVAWLAEALNDPAAARRAGPYITAQSFQFTADVAAIGHYGHGYRRVKFVFDTTETTTNNPIAKIIYRQDLTHLGWALGRQVQLQTHTNSLAINNQ